MRAAPAPASASASAPAALAMPAAAPAAPAASVVEPFAPHEPGMSAVPVVAAAEEAPSVRVVEEMQELRDVFEQACDNLAQKLSDGLFLLSDRIDKQGRQHSSELQRIVDLVSPQISGSSLPSGRSNSETDSQIFSNFARLSERMDRIDNALQRQAENSTRTLARSAELDAARSKASTEGSGPEISSSIGRLSERMDHVDATLLRLAETSTRALEQFSTIEAARTEAERYRVIAEEADIARVAAEEALRSRESQGRQVSPERALSAKGSVYRELIGRGASGGITEVTVLQSVQAFLGAYQKRCFAGEEGSIDALKSLLVQQGEAKLQEQLVSGDMNTYAEIRSQYSALKSNDAQMIFTHQMQAAALWSSEGTATFRGEARELSWFINNALAEDDRELLEACLPMILGLNSITAEAAQSLPADADGYITIWRGGVFDADSAPALKEGQDLRISGFLAWSTVEIVKDQHLQHIAASGKSTLEWRLRIPRSRKRIIFLKRSHTLSAMEDQVLLGPYTTVIVESVEWSTSDDLQGEGVRPPLLSASAAARRPSRVTVRLPADDHQA